MLALLGSLSACVPPSGPAPRVPLAAPFGTVGGSRPARPQGLQAVGEFGDGVWGLAQERAEFLGFGLSYAFDDRVEVGGIVWATTRGVINSAGNEHTGQPTYGIRAKARLTDFGSGGGAVGVHLAYMTSHYEEDVQDERLHALDLAIPFALYPLSRDGPDHRLSLYAGPRLVLQSFRDQFTQVTATGTAAGALAGVAARWRGLRFAGELTVARTPSLSDDTTSFDGGWIALPMASVRLVF